MQTLFIDEKIKYNGVELSPHWIYKTFNKKGDCIVAFIGECEVKLQSMVDIEDVINNEPIYSDLMLNFIEENFHSTLTEAVFRQRLLATSIKEILEDRFPNINISRSGDDIYLNNRKLSVSIATKSITSTLIHFGINIDATHAPINAASLSKDLNYSINQVKEFALSVLQRYNEEVEDIDNATCKVRGVTE